MGWALKDGEKVGGKSLAEDVGGDGKEEGQEVSLALSVLGWGYLWPHIGNPEALSPPPVPWQPGPEPLERLVGRFLTRKEGSAHGTQGILSPRACGGVGWAFPTSPGFWACSPGQAGLPWKTQASGLDSPC